MSPDITKVWDSNQARQLAEVLCAITEQDTMCNLLRDVMTEKEILEISARLEAAKLLSNGAAYTDVIRKTRLSSRTIARISDWLKNGCDGYRAALLIINQHHAHMKPAHAD